MVGGRSPADRCCCGDTKSYPRRRTEVDRALEERRRPTPTAGEDSSLSTFSGRGSWVDETETARQATAYFGGLDHSTTGCRPRPAHMEKKHRQDWSSKDQQKTLFARAPVNQPESSCWKGRFIAVGLQVAKNSMLLSLMGIACCLLDSYRLVQSAVNMVVFPKARGEKTRSGTRHMKQYV